MHGILHKYPMHKSNNTSSGTKKSHTVYPPVHVQKLPYMLIPRGVAQCPTEDDDDVQIIPNPTAVRLNRPIPQAFKPYKSRNKKSVATRPVNVPNGTYNID